MHTGRAPVLQFRVIERLCMARGGIVSLEDLIEHVYADSEDGGALTADECIRIAVFKLRRKGYAIVKHWGRGYSHGAF